MKIAVIYSSITGNTKKIAKAIAQEIRADLFPVKSPPKLQDYDLIFLGSGTYGNRPHQSLISFIKKTNLSGKKVAGFMTYASNRKGLDFLEALLLDKKAKIIGLWGTTSRIIFILKRSHPDKSELSSALIFAKNIVQKIKKS